MDGNNKKENTKRKTKDNLEKKTTKTSTKSMTNTNKKNSTKKTNSTTKKVTTKKTDSTNKKITTKKTVGTNKKSPKEESIKVVKNVSTKNKENSGQASKTTKKNKDIQKDIGKEKKSESVKNISNNKKVSSEKSQVEVPVLKQTTTKTKRHDEEKEEKKNRKWLIILLLLLLFFLFILDVDDLLLGKPLRPKVSKVDDDWHQQVVIKIEKDSISRKRISHYLYCIRDDKNLKKCEWQRTDTKSILVTKDGINHVWFKAVTEDGKVGKPSKPVEVKIDNEAAEDIKIKTKTTQTTIKVKVTVEDNGSEIEKYYYKIEDGKYIEKDDDTYTFKDLKPGTTYQITVKVVDKLGNEKEITFKVTTKKTDEKDSDSTTENDSSDKTSEDNNNKNNNNNNNGGNNNSNNNTSGNDSDLEEIPSISLSGVPKQFKMGEDYKLPTSYRFGKSGGTVKCTIRDKQYKSTKDLLLGSQIIKCSAVSNKGVEVKIEKEVEVVPLTTEELTWDGWIRMNLYYPENSTDWQWRIGNEEEVRTGFNNTSWLDYLGPITVRLSDVENIYIRYKLPNGEEEIIAPNGRLIVDIQPAKYQLKEGKTTTVVIKYNTDADKKQFRTNGGEWQNYTGEFTVSNDTQIEARVVKIVNSYDENGNIESSIKQTNYDSVYISTLVENEGTTGEGNGGSTGESSSSSGSTGDLSSGSGLTGNPSSGSGSTGGSSIVGSSFNVITGPNYMNPPSYAISGPIISVTPDTLTEIATITLTTKKEARAIYYKIGSSGRYQKYEAPFTIKKNATIYAYYIKDENGQTSKVSSKYVGNIKQANKPSISIDVSTTKKYQSNVTVSLSASDYDILEYSLDGEIYQNYIGSFSVTENCTVYARAKNQYGVTYEQREITNISSTPAPKEDLTIGIFTIPDSSSIDGLLNQVTVEIDYDQRAAKKYYKIGNGSYQEYVGPFTVSENTTVTAYATASNASGKTSKIIDFLTSGISQPIIRLNTNKPSTSVTVTIDYDKNASQKSYRIGTGELLEYMGPFELSENEMIYAYSKNELGNESESYYQVTNITSSPKYILLDQGSYFILRLNYPAASSPELREYKWSTGGEWKNYNSQGILLIKQEYKDEILQKDENSSIKVKDESGRELIFTDHYYVVDRPLNELMENLFMRWGYEDPTTPSIQLSTLEPATSLYATIKFDKDATTNEYKISTPDGNITDWMSYDGKIKINRNNTIIYARSISGEDKISEVASKRVTNIDEEDPEVDARADFDSPTRKLTIQIIGTDDLKVHCVGWGKGIKDLEYFEDAAALLDNYSTFTVNENGTYTLYVEDEVGNTNLKQIEVQNIDKDAPDIEINVLTKKYGTKAEVEIDYGNSTDKQYKIGTNGTYQPYTGKLTISSYDVFSLANADGTLTIYAKGTDEAGNVQEISETLYVLDLDIPKSPVIHSSSGYPCMTEYGLDYNNLVNISYDNRDSISNYYSLDNGKTWKIYTGPFSIESGVVIAKSVKKESNLTVTMQKEVSFPSDSIKWSAFDGNVSNGYSMTNDFVGSATHYVNLDQSMENQTIEIHASHSCYTYRYIKFYDQNNNVISEYSYTPSCYPPDYRVTSYVVPKGARKLSVGANRSGNGGMALYEVKLRFKNDINVSQNYPTVTLSGIVPAYNTASVNYYSTSVQKLYKINNGEWLSYKNSNIRLKLGDILYVKGIDKYGTATETNQYTSTTISGGVKPAAYDNNTSSGYVLSDLTIRETNYLSIDSSVWGGTLKVYAKHACKTYRYITFYNSKGEVLSSNSYSPSCSQSDYQTTTYGIPKNSTIVGINGGYSGNGGVTLYEVWANSPTIEGEKDPDGKEESNISFVPSPTINVSNSDKYTAEKVVEISYPAGGYTNEYSFDAVNWTKYTGKITIDKETTVYARSVSDDDVVSASSHQITKIDNIKPTISLNNIPLEIKVGDDYPLPSNYSFNNNKTGGTVKCIIDDTIKATSTNTLTPGEHHIKCSITTGSGLVESAEANINVIEPTIDPPEEEEKEGSGEETGDESDINNEGQEEIEENEEEQEDKTNIE